MYKQCFNNLMRDELDEDGYVVKRVKGESFRTIAGITEKYYPNAKIWQYLDDNESVKEELIKEFYYHTFYTKMNLDKIDDYAICNVVFNTSVLFGKKKSTQMVQRVLKISQDGIFGEHTTNMLQCANNKEFVYEYLLECIEFINYLNKPYLKGWLNRMMRLFGDSQKYYKDLS